MPIVSQQEMPFYGFDKHREANRLKNIPTRNDIAFGEPTPKAIFIASTLPNLCEQYISLVNTL
jgi:hypothetical protein